MSRRPRHPRRGFTLSELTVSAFIMGLVMVGVASSVMVATEALPDEDDPSQAAVRAAAIADQIVEELRYAIAITERSGTVIAFAVGDRDSDGAPERIRYAWSGTAGDPLTREYNGGTAVEIAQDVHRFSLSYHLDAVTEEYPGPTIESAETVLASFAGAGGKKFKVEHRNHVGQYFNATLPAGAKTWRVTRVGFEAAKDGAANGVTRVQLRTADSNKRPTDTVLEEYFLEESTLGSNFTWQEYAFNSVTNLQPDAGLCLVLQWVSGGKSAGIHYNNAGNAMVYTDNDGFTWDSESSESLVYTVHGTALAPGPPQEAERRYLTAVRVALQIGGDSSTRSTSATPALNRPELLDAFWELDFNTVPTIDRNGDNQADWGVRTGAFNTDSLSAGIWSADAILDTKPNNDFSSLTTINVRFRNTSLGGNGAVYQMNADWYGSTCAPLFALAMLQPDGTQTLSVNHYEASVGAVPLVEVGGLPGSFVALRMMIDPELDTVNVNVNGLDVGTYLYNTVAPPTSDRFATIRRSGSNAEFDFISIRVSEDDN
ncbi:MAG: prepilin-type N-terminal cleavage/methylation domain-containing protein [Phycisphaerales bacterium]|nr:prepilin-type N-terminal cleavage/methylation domain-containing protein [Phycisphaerales bacterium]